MADQTPNEPQTPPSVYDHIAVIIQQMAQVCWQKLGLQPDTITGKLEQNLDEAKVAVEVITRLTAILEPQLDDEDRRQIHNMIRDLRINVAQKITGAGA